MRARVSWVGGWETLPGIGDPHRGDFYRELARNSERRLQDLRRQLRAGAAEVALEEAVLRSARKELDRHLRRHNFL